MTSSITNHDDRTSATVASRRRDTAAATTDASTSQQRCGSRKRSRAAQTRSTSTSTGTTGGGGGGVAGATFSTATLMLLIGSVILSSPSSSSSSSSNNINTCHAFSSSIDRNIGSSFRRRHHQQMMVSSLSMASSGGQSSSSSSSKSGLVELAEQKATVSAEKRDAAIKAMKRDAMASALDGVDAQMLEMLSDEFLFPTLSSSSSSSSSESGSNSADGPSSSNFEFDTHGAIKYGDETEYEELTPDYGPPPSSTRPSGRPNMVPGAMRKDTLAKYKKRRNLVKYIKRTTESAAATVASRSAASVSGSSGTVGDGSPPSSSSASSFSSRSSSSSGESMYPATKSMLDGLETRIHVKSREIARKKRRLAQQRGAVARSAAAIGDGMITTEELPGTTSTSSVDGAAATETETDETKSNSKKKSSKKRRVVKNLPKRKTAADFDSLDDSFKSLMSSDPTLLPSSSKKKKTRKLKGAAANQLELRKYYQTELLTPDQEFDLGHKIQIVVMCDRVHEGLALRDMQLPTIRKWANACGYTDPDPDFDEDTLINQDIRPLGADKMFEKTDPNMFVGNGLAHTMGVGRGRGRAKKPPPVELKDVFEIDTKTGQKKKGATTPINRGTVSDFVDMILDGRTAKQLMVQSNMRLVVSICRKYSNVGVGLQDLVQEGSIGLSRAADKYDPSKGFKFSTYASWWIQQAVFRSIAYHSRTIRLPVHIHNMLNRVRKVRSNLHQGLGRQPTDEEMADAMDMKPSKYKRMLQLTRRSISLELPHYKQNPKDQGFEGEDTLADMAATNAQQNDSGSDNVLPERTVDRSLFQEDLKGMLKKLTKDERTVIALRYGLADGLTRTITSVAAELKQTPSVVRSHESKALRKLRRPWYEKKLDEHRQSLLG
eukprot:CAMPEP_0113507284 /NCGR_PEP_ID=MMETSP0014_2-20120614/36378_1 /TAXON_ID=2857 /ORGANISM="Nitzschia sp." /LENGTH=887 /DNA_ID=CAMNT_0000402873 /DNA_START=202 /DNA_END=2865 /DNA_ORIENTATION=+ /assembly_acc=CAM_ASM_000159